METGRQYTAKVKELLNEAAKSGKYVYIKPMIPGGNPTRIVRVSTQRGLTLAHTIAGGNFPVSSLNINDIYIQ